MIVKLCLKKGRVNVEAPKNFFNIISNRSTYKKALQNL